MTIWFTSDTHFGQEKVIRLSDRPFESPEHMNDVLIDEWNACVRPSDRVYHLGDFAFRDHAKMFRALNGCKHLIIGNHDRKETLDLPWHLVVDNLSTKFEGLQFFLHHYAGRVWNRSHHGSFHLFGHSHGTLPDYGRSMDVGVDRIVQLTGSYRPISLDEILDRLEPIEFLAGKSW